MKISRQQAVAAYRGFQDLVEQRLEAGVDTRVAAVFVALERHAADHDRITEKLREHHALRDEDGELVPRRDLGGDPIPDSWQPADPKAWRTAIDRLDRMEVEVPDEVFTRDELSTDDYAPTPLVIARLGPFMSGRLEVPEPADTDAVVAALMGSGG